MAKKNFSKVLLISTSNITRRDNEILRDRMSANDDHRVMEYEYGYIVSAWTHYNEQEPGEIEAFEVYMTKLGFSDHYLKLLRHAAKQDCRWMNIDRDEDVLDGFPEFDWAE